MHLLFDRLFDRKVKKNERKTNRENTKINEKHKTYATHTVYSLSEQKFHIGQMTVDFSISIFLSYSQQKTIRAT